MDFTCVNCSRLTAISFTSEDLTVYRCNICDMEYRLITGSIEKNVSMRSSKVINEIDEFSAMPIRVEIKQS